MTGVPDDEADYVAFLTHGPACPVCTAGRPCQVNNDLRAAAQVSAIAVLTASPPGVVPVPGCKTIHLVDEFGTHEVARVEVDRCSWCRVQGAGLVAVGILHAGVGWDITACNWCVRLHDLLPLDQHPDGGRRLPLHRNGAPAAIPKAEP
ncbi:hypothetical protein OG292_19455 [Streptomyces sp. NBC_01511]|uniref:hypothetical protein n=1 Tax=Streptomyces sp. NBC_01511 TaxID=2903889 RepID=UPI00386B10E6